MKPRIAHDRKKDGMVPGRPMITNRQEEQA